MKCLTAYNKSYDIEDLNTKINFKHFWTFNSLIEGTEDCDFLLHQISYVDETTSKAVQLELNNTKFWVPAHWEILVVDLETSKIDTVIIEKCSASQHDAFLFCPQENRLFYERIKVVDFCDKMTICSPQVPRTSGLIHPIGKKWFNLKQKDLDLGVILSPHDIGKNLVEKRTENVDRNAKLIGDLLYT